MEVSDQPNKFNLISVREPDSKAVRLDSEAAGPDSMKEEHGHQLLDTVVSLTGLPERVISDELDEILTLSGHDSGTLTLEQLREAMLMYLECIQQTVENQARA